MKEEKPVSSKSSVVFFPPFTVNVSACRPPAIAPFSSKSLHQRLHFYSPRWLKMWLCFSAKLHHAQTQKRFLCHIFACSEASNCRRSHVTSAIFIFFFFFSLLLIWRKVFIFIYQSLLPLRGKEKLQCLQYWVCVRVSGGCAAMLGVIMKRLKCDRRFLWLGIKTPSYLFK